jgi:hypothetical protein
MISKQKILSLPPVTVGAEESCVARLGEESLVQNASFSWLIFED